MIFNDEKPKFPQESEINIIVINLKRRPDRFYQFLLNFPWTESSFQRFDAIDGTQLVSIKDLPEIEKIISPLNDFNWRNSIVGCALSHYLVWKLIVETGKNTIVFEDDVLFFDQTTEIWDELVKEGFPKDFDIIYLGQGGQDVYEDKIYEKKFLQVKQDFKNFYSIKNYAFGFARNLSIFFTFLGILYSPKGAKKLIDLVEKNGINCAIDRIYWK